MRVIGCVVYPRFTALDAVGPYEVLARLDRDAFRFFWIAETLEPVVADRGLTLTPDAAFEDAPPIDVLLVPGGPGQFDQMENEALIGFIRRAAAAASVVASVCTGSLLLARAGLLTGKRATTHWLARDALAGLGAVPVDERIVWEGESLVTAAGVSAGIDLALSLAARLAGRTVAQAIQLGIEYDPQPPSTPVPPTRRRRRSRSSCAPARAASSAERAAQTLSYRIACLTSWIARVTWIPRGQASVQLNVVRHLNAPSF